VTKEQAFASNGQALDSIALERSELVGHRNLVAGTTHVWLWRRVDGRVEVLLQKRSMSKKNAPGKWDISAAGHIDEGETALETAVREAREELGLEAEKEKMYFVFSIRKTNIMNIIASIYLYEVDDDFTPTFHDGEVDTVDWKTIDEFADMVKNPDDHNIANHGEGYFTVLLERLKML
jgi:8-oxo-dGTP pyrophosphatase MutT (NUDIX family)